MKPKVATTVEKSSLIFSTFSRSEAGALGVSAVRMVMIRLCSCST